jgi:hypothetical protein
MTKLANVLMGLALIFIGVLGITGMVPMFQSNPAYWNIGEIVLGILGLIVGIYAKRTSKQEQEAKVLAKKTKENADRQKQDNDRLKKENNQAKLEQADRQRQEVEQLQKQNEKQKQENEQQRLKNEQQKQQNEQQKQNASN